MSPEEETKKLREAFYAGARAFFTADEVARQWQERALPEVYEKWVQETGAAAAAVLRRWTCPTCAATGKADPRHVPMFCQDCLEPKPKGRGKWVEVIWAEPPVEK